MTPNPKPKRKVKSDRKKAVERADREFSRYIRLRDHGRSVLSGSTESIQCGHVFTRAAYSTRWRQDNAFAITAGENLAHEHDPWPLLNHAMKVYGKSGLDALYAEHKRVMKYTTDAIERIADGYAKLCDSIEKMRAAK